MHSNLEANLDARSVKITKVPGNYKAELMEGDRVLVTAYGKHIINALNTLEARCES